MNKLTGRIYAILMVHLCWYVMAIALPKGLIPLPHVVWQYFIRLMLSGTLLLHMLSSLLRLSVAIGLALAIGIPIGLLSGISKWFDYFATPITYLLYPLPKIAFLPVFMLLFGLGDGSKVMLLFTVLVFQLIIATRDGVKQLPVEYVHVASIMRLSWRQKIRKLYFPSTLPHILNALKISVGISMAVLFFCENYATTYGLGYYIMNNWTMVNYPGMFSGIIAMAIVAAGLIILIDKLHDKLCKWHVHHQQS